MSTLRHGDYITYTPESLFRRDGYASVDEYGGTIRARDTYDVNDTELTPAELDTATVLFNRDEFEQRAFVGEDDWAPEDIFVLPTRKGLVVRKYVRIGAEMLSESEMVRRRQARHEREHLAARAALLSPLADQALAATPMPELTFEESDTLMDTIQWIQRASRSFNQQLGHLVRIQNGGDGRLDFAIVHADEDHYELVRARRALDKRLADLRSTV